MGLDNLAKVTLLEEVSTYNKHLLPLVLRRSWIDSHNEQKNVIRLMKIWSRSFKSSKIFSWPFCLLMATLVFNNTSPAQHRPNNNRL